MTRGLDKSSFLILVVDDETVITELVKVVVRDCGYTCQTATSGAEALVLTKEHSFHLIITDIRMPGISGADLADAVREASPDTLVAFMTGYAEYDTLSQAIKLRPFGYLEKPFLPDQIISLVEKAHQHWNQAESLRVDAKVLEQTVADKTKELEFKTDRLLAEKELLNGIIEHANFGLIAIDSAGFTHLLNPLAVQFLTIEPAVAAAHHGLPYESLLSDGLREPISALLKEARQSDSLQAVEFVNPSNDKSLGVIAYPILHKSRTVAIVLIIHDLTDKAVLQKRLLQSAKLASIGELAAGVAHEINNPLGFVISNCSTLGKYAATIRRYVSDLEALAEHPPADRSDMQQAMTQLKKQMDTGYIMGDLENLLAETQDGLGRVAKIVSDLKRFAHPDNDNLQPSNINELIDDALNLVRNETKYCLDIQRNYGDLTVIQCLPSQLVQVFTNIFVNAAHAVKGRGQLEITTSCSPASIRISIKDNGSGIPEKYLTRIFDPFFTTKPQGKGTGMGLSISYGIIQRHGGTITVNSTEGVGTEFVIDLPMSPVNETASAEALVTA
jgi:signal transduction histidine kinase/FixJ family two-component response regulator